MTPGPSPSVEPEPGKDNWDIRHGVAIKRILAAEDFPSVQSGAQRAIIPAETEGDLPLDVLYEPEDSKTLLVVLHGALNRRKFDLPRFEWRGTLQNVRASKLYLSDTTVSRRSDMELGWYIGGINDDLTARYANLVRHVRDAHSYDQVMFIGSSGGGFAGLAMSRQLAESSAVAFSPQSSIAGYHPTHRRVLSNVLAPGSASFETLKNELGSRISLRLLYNGTEDNNYFRYIQNTGDPFHYEAHYAPFAMSQGVVPEDGGFTSSGRGYFIAEKYEKGHAPPPRSRFRTHIMNAHNDFYSSRLILDQ